MYDDEVKGGSKCVCVYIHIYIYKYIYIYKHVYVLPSISLKVDILHACFC
jgi:hypothetical protein